VSVYFCFGFEVVYVDVVGFGVCVGDLFYYVDCGDGVDVDG